MHHLQLRILYSMSRYKEKNDIWCYSNISMIEFRLLFRMSRLKEEVKAIKGIIEEFEILQDMYDFVDN